MRVVIDTSALLQIFTRRGQILRFKNLIKFGLVENFISTYILVELEAGVPRLGHTRQKAKATLGLVNKLSNIYEPSSIPKVCRDPKDDAILALADEVEADYIVTFDKDLLVLKDYKHIKIIQLDELYKLFENKK